MVVCPEKYIFCAVLHHIAGDNPYSVIRNKDITDGSSCIVVKESYGNAFVPFLADPHAAPAAKYGHPGRNPLWDRRPLTNYLC